MIKKTIVKINHFFAEISGWLLCVIIILLIADLVGRGISKPLQGVSELAIFVMVSVVYCGLAHTEEIRGHVRVTALIGKLPPLLRKVSNVLVYLLATATFSIVTWAVAKNALKSFNSQEAVAGTVPLLIWPVKSVIFLGCLFYLVQIVVNLVEEVFKETD